MKPEDIAKYSENSYSDYKDYDENKQEESSDNDLLQDFFKNYNGKEKLRMKGDDKGMLAKGISQDRKLDLPKDFMELLKNLAKDSNSDENTIIKKGLLFLRLAERAKKDGLKIVLIDENEDIVLDVEGF